MDNNFDINQNSHRRKNPLTGQWVLVSPHRAKRPWQGQSEPFEEKPSTEFDPNCYLCPGNKRINGEENPAYEDTFVFNNDFSALNPELHATSDNDSELFSYSSARGISRVICYSPHHNKSIPELSIHQIQKIVDTWLDQLNDLKKDYVWVQIFENKGELMGCSQPHPHGQIWANDFIPNEVSLKDKNQESYYSKRESILLLDYAKAEMEKRERIVLETDHWIVVVPYWAAWPFETLLMPKNRHISRFEALSDAEKKGLSIALKDLTTRYDNLFRCSFPYSMGWHFAPYARQGSPCDYWQLHASFYPPLLRSASIKKFMVGYEMFAEPQRDLTPEQAASRLKEQSNVHYKES